MNISTFGILSVALGLVHPPTTFAEFFSFSSEESNPLGSCELPSSLVGELGLGEHLEDDDYLSIVLAEYRRAHPEQFAPTPPPQAPVRIAGDFEPAHTLQLAYPGIAEYDELFGDIIDATTSQGQVQVFIQREKLNRFSRMLRRRRIPLSSIDLITDVPFDTVWLRDYGPQPIITSAGLGFVDGRYFLNCLDDDRFPARFAARTNRLEEVPVYRPDLWTEGGNLLSNGRGLCLSTTYLVSQNSTATEEEIKVKLRDYYGCEDTLFLVPLAGNAVQHIDMFLYFASEELILLGEIEESQDPSNHAILEQNARTLTTFLEGTGRPHRIIRVPLPDPVDFISGAPEGPLILTHLNMLAFNDVVLVPVYETDDSTPTIRALDIIQDAFPERFVIPIPADVIALDGGTIHCITQTYPLVVQRH